MAPTTGNDYFTNAIYHSEKPLPTNTMRDKVSYNDVQISNCHVAELRIGSLHIKDFDASNISIGQIAIDHMQVNNGDGDDEVVQAEEIDDSNIRNDTGPADEDNVSVTSKQSSRIEISPQFRPGQSTQIAAAQALESQFRAARALKRSERSRAEHQAQDQASQSAHALFDPEKQAYFESVSDLNTAAAQPDLDAVETRSIPALSTADSKKNDTGEELHPEQECPEPHGPPSNRSEAPKFLHTQRGIELPRLPTTVNPEVTKTPTYRSLNYNSPDIENEHDLMRQSYADPEPPPKSPTVFPAIAIPQVLRPPESPNIFPSIPAVQPPEMVLHPQPDRLNNTDIQFLRLTEADGSTWRSLPNFNNAGLQQMEAGMRDMDAPGDFEISGRTGFSPRNRFGDVREMYGQNPDDEEGELAQMARFEDQFGPFDAEAANRRLADWLGREDEGPGR